MRLDAERALAWRLARHALEPASATSVADVARRVVALRAWPANLAEGLTGYGSDSLHEPLHWWGDICFGPDRAGGSTFRRLADDPAWPGLPDLADAGPRAVTLYLGAHGPATARHLASWLTDALVLTEHLEEIARASPSDIVHLLPGYDPWVMGPGTADARHVALPGRRGRRALVRRLTGPLLWRVSVPDDTISHGWPAGSPARGRGGTRMALRWYSVVVDCEDVAAQARWWAEALDWRLFYEAEDEAVLLPKHASMEKLESMPWSEVPPGLVFVRVPERKSVKNRLHLDLAPHTSDDRDAEIERLVALGARRVDVGQSEDVGWTVLADPEGNEFCILSSREL